MRPGLKPLVALLAALVLGLGSASNRISDNRELTNGPWRIWPAYVIPAASPYTLTHYLREGNVPPDASQSLIYTAATDSEGDRLYGSCDYIITGPMPGSRWWSLGIENGPLLSSGRVVLSPDGGFEAHVSRFATPGNWLKTADRGRFRLILRLQGPGGELKASPDKAGLPQIRKDGDC